jgi:AGZA family xanthine/uracil permease-like MFS transporter
MLKGLRRIDPRAIDELAPVAATLLATLVTVNLINGIACGALAYLVVELVRGRAARIGAPMWAIAGLFALYYLLLFKLG